MSARAVGYVRVSTEMQVEDGLSMEAQRREIAAYCERPAPAFRTLVECAAGAAGVIVEDVVEMGGPPSPLRPLAFDLRPEWGAYAVRWGAA